jgi:hypothetical protein
VSKKFWNTEKFKKLEKTWNKKLAESGFVDIEHKSGNLKQNASNSYRTTIRETIDSKLRYFELLGQGIQEEDFKDLIERFIMEKKGEGLSTLEICRQLRRFHRAKVSEVIRHYEIKWKIKKT